VKSSHQTKLRGRGMVHPDLKMGSRCGRSAALITKSTTSPKPGTVSSNVYNRPRTKECQSVG